MTAGEPRRREVLSIVLVRQRYGSSKSVIVIVLEDETVIVSLVVWCTVFETKRRVILGACMIAVVGQVQCEDDVVHHITEVFINLACIGPRGDAFTLDPGHGGELSSTCRSFSGAKAAW